MKYKIKKNAVIHNCPNYGVERENLLESAGQNDNCPNCHENFIVPGESELGEIKRKAQELEDKKKEDQIKEKKRQETAAHWAEIARIEKAKEEKNLAQAVMEFEQKGEESVKDDLKKCPFCCETIKAEAIKCRHCGTMLNQPNGQMQYTQCPHIDHLDRKRLWDLLGDKHGLLG